MADDKLFTSTSSFDFVLTSVATKRSALGSARILTSIDRITTQVAMRTSNQTRAGRRSVRRIALPNKRNMVHDSKLACGA